MATQAIIKGDFKHEKSGTTVPIECWQIVSQVNMALKKYANVNYKITPYVEPRDVEQIKALLVNYTCKDKRASEFKNELIEDLSQWQQHIHDEHMAKIKEFTRKKMYCESQIKVLESQKNKLIMQRLSQIAWPYDSKTKEFDTQIAKFSAQLEHYSAKLQQVIEKRPAATEKDLLLYQLQTKDKLKQKYAA